MIGKEMARIRVVAATTLWERKAPVRHIQEVVDAIDVADAAIDQALRRSARTARAALAIAVAGAGASVAALAVALWP